MLEDFRDMPRSVVMMFLLTVPIFIMAIASANMLSEQFKIVYEKNDSKLINTIKKFEPKERSITEINNIQKIDSSKFSIEYNYTQNNGEYEYEGTTGELNINEINDEEFSFAISTRDDLDNKGAFMVFIFIVIFFVTGLLGILSIAFIYDEL